MLTILKVSYGDDVRRLTMKDELTYSSVMKMILDEWPSVVGLGCKVKYQDDEGDSCTLAPATFDDFLILNDDAKATTTTGRRIIKLSVHLPVSPPVIAVVNGAAAATEGDAATRFVPPGKGNNFCVPPGLNELPDTSNWSSSTHCGRGAADACDGAGGGGPLKVLKVIRELRDAGLLTAPMLASLTVQWLPMITQRVTRKLEKINWVTLNHGISVPLRSFLELLAEVAAASPCWAHFVEPLQNVLAGRTGLGTVSLGEVCCGLLKALLAQPFEVQMSVIEQLAEKLVPLIDELAGICGPRCGTPAPLPHDGVTCDACGTAPIVGPRFKCTTCSDYDLCGNCFPRKSTIHVDKSGAPCSHDFSCVLPQSNETGGKGWKGCGKGWKGKGWKCGKANLPSAAEGQNEGNAEDASVNAAPWWRHGAGKGGKDGEQWREWWWHHMQAKWNMKGKSCEKGWRGWANQQACQGDAVVEASADRWSAPAAHDGCFGITQKCHAEGAQKKEAVLRAEVPEFKPQGLDELDGKLKLLKDIGLGNDELDRELLAANDGDHIKVIQLLVAE